MNNLNDLQNVPRLSEHLFDIMLRCLSANEIAFSICSTQKWMANIELWRIMANTCIKPVMRRCHSIFDTNALH